MKKLCKKLLALALVICMLSSFAIFVSAETDSKICVSVSASVLETTLQEYVSANMSSATFYQGECFLSTGESGYCYIGYSDSAKAFYIQCFFPSNSSYRWCYKFDLDYVWKHRIEYVSDNVSWEIVGGFTIQFIDHFVNYGQPLDIDDLDPRCKLLFEEIDQSDEDVNENDNIEYYPKSNQELINEMYFYSGKNSDDYFYEGEVNLSRYGICTAEFGWDVETFSFYIKPLNNNPEGKFLYQFSIFDKEFGWKYQDISTNSAPISVDSFCISFMNDGAGCPSSIDFLFTTQHPVVDSDEEQILRNGVYCFKNSQVGKYMQLDNNDSPEYDSEDKPLELWDFDGGDYQKWFIKKCEDEYYTIMSAVSGKFISVKSGNENEDEKYLVQEEWDDNDSDRQLWSITKTSIGTYVFRPKSAESYNEDWCMSAGDQFLWITDGLNVEQREYSNNNKYKDEWILESPILNIDIYADQKYKTKHPGYEKRIEFIMNIVKEKYFDEFGIIIEYSEVKDHISVADICNSEDCPNFDDYGGCSNHKSVDAILDYAIDNIYSPNNVFVFSGYSDALAGAYLPDTTYAVGLYHSDIYFEISTVFHEIGHYYGVLDHYDDQADGFDDYVYSTSELGEPFSSGCIYGELQSDFNIYENLIMCEGCKEIIFENNYRFNYQD